MKRASIFKCGHPGARRRYVSTFSTVQRVDLCDACTVEINENGEDPRSIADTVSEAVQLRDHKHGGPNGS